MGEQRAGQGRVGFLDDDLEFIETLDVWKDESQASVLITSSPEEFFGLGAGAQSRNSSLRRAHARRGGGEGAREGARDVAGSESSCAHGI